MRVKDCWFGQFLRSRWDQSPYVFLKAFFLFRRLLSVLAFLFNHSVVVPILLPHFINLYWLEQCVSEKILSVLGSLTSKPSACHWDYLMILQVIRLSLAVKSVSNHKQPRTQATSQENCEGETSFFIGDGMVDRNGSRPNPLNRPSLACKHTHTHRHYEHMDHIAHHFTVGHPLGI